MNRLLFIAAAGLCLSACTKQESTSSKPETTSKQKTEMKNLVSIVEIPATDFSRATAFYENILGISLEEAEMEGIKIGVFPSTDGGVVVQLIHGADYKPSMNGTIVYLSGGDDLQKVADKVEANGGRILVRKTAIGPDMGFFAIFTDTEGNKLGLYSLQ